MTETVYYQQYSQAAKIVPFPFTIAAAIGFILVCILKCTHPSMHFRTSVVALLALIELGSWAVFLAF